MVAERDAPIPITLLTGFLGSGKTTLLAALLRRLRGERVAVLLDEVDGTALDHPLLGALEPAALELLAGCLCCAGRAGFADAVARLVARRPSRIVLETAGSTDPAPVLDALARDPRLSALVRPAGVVTLLDVPRADELLDAHAEARRQLELADRVVLTQVERAPGRLPAVRARVATLAPGAEVREAGPDGEDVDAAWLLDGPALPRMAEGDGARAWLHAAGTPDFILTRSVHVLRAADPGLLQLWLRLVTQLDGPRLLRVKLLAEDVRDGGAVVLQAVGAWVAPVRRLEQPPDGHVGVRAALVSRDLSETALERIVGSLHEAVAAAHG
ncbi:MAG: hypothetical protein H6825_08025 [Planctomycetes bacterium]|nr:hypothetical protein [Planctomycetota bacterium]